MNGLEIWGEIELDDKCEGCRFYIVTPNMYGLPGGSPTEHSCHAVSWQQCVRVEDRIREMEEEDD